MATSSAAPPLSDEQDRQQSHPLHADDRGVVDRLLAAETPADEDLVHLARLLMRYEGFPGAADLRDDLGRLLERWQLDREELHRRTRALWAAGFRPGSVTPSGSVGSGFDTADQDTP